MITTTVNCKVKLFEQSDDGSYHGVEVNSKKASSYIDLLGSYGFMFSIIYQLEKLLVLNLASIIDQGKI